jgi:O-antigen/teichoic acid export membrane protein
LTLSSLYALAVFGYTLLKHAPILVPVCVSLLLLPTLLMLDYGVAFALGSRRHGLASVLRAVGPIIYSLCTILLYLTGTGSLDAITIVYIGATLVAGVLALCLGVRAVLRIKPAHSIIHEVGARGARREVLAFGRRGYIGLLSPTDTLRLDQLLIAFLLPARVVGIYAVGAAFTNFTRTVGLYVGMSGTTEVARHADVESQRAVVRHTLRQTALVVAPLTVIVGLLLVVMIPLLFGEVYSSAVPIGECLLVATGLLAMKRVAVDLLRGAGETRLGTRAEIINVVAFLVLCVPAALALGGVGVAASLALATTTGCAYLLRQMQTHGFLGRTSPSRH